jgi:precorrin-3B methylase
VGSDAESVTLTTLAELDLDVVDMRTLLIIGSSTTRVVPGAAGPLPRVYTPRRYPA